MDPIPAWKGDIDALRAMQLRLTAELRLRDDFVQPLRTVAGVVARGIGDGSSIRAVVAVLDAASLQVTATSHAELPAEIPLLTGLRSFSVLPAALQAFESLPQPPDLLLVEGHGSAHPNGFGLACHLGLATGLPAIGVSSSVLVGTHKPLHEMRGAFAPLREDGRQIGWILRSKVGEPPLVVSPGHRVSQAAAPQLVMEFVRDGRLPAPLLAAQALFASLEFPSG